MIKFGRAKYRVREFSIENRLLKRTNFIPELSLDSKREIPEGTACRICLDKEESNDNPLIWPCKW